MVVPKTPMVPFCMKQDFLYDGFDLGAGYGDDETTTCSITIKCTNGNLLRTLLKRIKNL